MAQKKLFMFLIAAGLVVAATSAAFNLNTPHWFSRGGSVASKRISSLPLRLAQWGM
ncbi:MAG: hypothetical protein Q7U28_11080 [Aquabacterium sp.]|nr:hypothetical protein [Aquabacterium sp.]